MFSKTGERAKYALDTNMFVGGFNSDSAAAELDEFFRRSLAVTFLSAIVVQELRAGTRTAREIRHLERSIIEPFERRGRVFAPSLAAFKASGRILADLAAAEGREFIRSRRSLPDDTLLAASCRQHGITLISRDRDFERFRSSLGRWRSVQPWP
jgi:predicted nucleic acid-binding protein